MKNCILVLLFCGASMSGHAQSTAFTYQGLLDSGGARFTGTAEFQPTLWDAASGGSQVGANTPAQVFVSASNGLFVLPLNFGNSFPGDARWLQLEVRTVIGPFITLTPRQPITPTPYAITAASLASGSNGYAVTFNNPANHFTGTFSGNGAGITNMNAATLNGLDGSSFWKLGGNTGANPANGAFLGTTDLLPLELRVNGARALRLEPNTNGSPNVIGGATVNHVSSSVVGATISGGGATSLDGFSYTNSVGADFGTVSGGLRNSALGPAATVSGGSGNTAGANWATVSGGAGNRASGRFATVVGGNQSTASGEGATVLGGAVNMASGDYSFAAGRSARALHAGSFVWNDNTAGTGFESTTFNQFSIRAAGGIRLAGNVELESSTYRYLSLSGGNALGYLYGSFPAFGDGIHLSYNYYADANGVNRVFNTGGPTSRLSVGYGFVGLYIGGVNAAPLTQRLFADSTGVTVNGTFNNSSDRNAKRDFAPISPLQILEKVVQLPISEWSYKEDPATRHISPVAQDFHAAFQVGTDDKHIAPLDQGGVGLAAIQGLNEKLTSELKRRDIENAELQRELRELKALVKKLADRVEETER